MSKIVLSLLFLAISATPESSQGTPEILEWSAAENEIWALETAYMTHLKEGNIDGVAAFFHQDFLGWPSHSAEPVGRSEARASVERLLEDLQITGVKLRPQAIHLEGGLAVVHYLVVLTINGEEEVPEAAVFRLTHTWIKERGEWKILGGMSARLVIEQ